MIGFDGMESSRITSLPWCLRTRCISVRPFGRFSKLRTPKATPIRLNVPSAYGIASQSPVWSSAVMPSLSHLSLPIFSIPSERSMPMIFDPSGAALAISMVKSHVPHASSRMLSGSLVSVISFTAFLRHDLSMFSDRM